MPKRRHQVPRTNSDEHGTAAYAARRESATGSVDQECAIREGIQTATALAQYDMFPAHRTAKTRHAPKCRHATIVYPPIGYRLTLDNTRTHKKKDRTTAAPCFPAGAASCTSTAALRIVASRNIQRQQHATVQSVTAVELRVFQSIQYPKRPSRTYSINTVLRHIKKECGFIPTLVLSKKRERSTPYLTKVWTR